MPDLLENIGENNSQIPHKRGEDLAYCELFRSLIKIYVGTTGQIYTPALLADATGIPQKTIENWTQPSGAGAAEPDYLRILCAFLPKAFSGRIISFFAGHDVVHQTYKEFGQKVVDMGIRMMRGQE